ncbi:MAG: hypothetical protein U0176_08975 [Bacteroidia bacterium]
MPFLDLLQQVMSDSREDFPLLVQAQSLAWRLTRFDDANCYHELKAQLEEHGDSLPESEVSTLYRLLLNYCYARVNAEEPGWEEEVNALHVKLLENGILVSQGQIPAGIFKNIVQGRLNVADLDGVRKFLEEWGSRIQDDTQGAALIYNQGLLAFYEQDFGVCLRAMETVLRDYRADVHYGIDARVIALMCVFERNKSEDWMQEFEARLNAFRLYLIRDQRMEEARRVRHLELVKHFRKLMSLHQDAPGQRQQRALKFIEGIQSLKPASKRRWFERQASAYE